MHAHDLDDAAVGVLRALGAGDVQFVLLEDEDPQALTIVPGPSARNLERLVRVLKRQRATFDGTPKWRAPDFDELVRHAPSRWPVQVGGATLDLVRLGVDDGRWSAYFDQAEQVVVHGGLHVDVVPDQAVLTVKRANAYDAMPELALSRRERERVRRRRREALSRAERRGARRQAVAVRLAGWRDAD